MRPTRAPELPLHSGASKKSNISKLNNAFEKVGAMWILVDAICYLFCESKGVGHGRVEENEDRRGR